MTRIRSPILSASAFVLAALVLVPASLGQSAGAFEQEQAFAKNRHAVHEQAVALLKLDATAKRRFQEAHPKARLPEQRLTLPKPTAPAFDWCNLNCVSDAHRQRSGDCWANAAIEALECSDLIRNGHRLRHGLSPQPILDHYEHDQAAQPGTAFQFLLKHGTTTLDKYPYTGKHGALRKDVATPYRAAAWGYVSPNNRRATTAQLKQALLDHGPLCVAVYFSPKFRAYTGGVFDEHYEPKKEGRNPTHAVLLVGWDDRRGRKGCWKIKNSWRPDWGEQGFMWIEYDCNHIGMGASWVLAASRSYTPGDGFYTVVKDAQPLPSPRPTASQTAASSQKTRPASAKR